MMRHVEEYRRLVGLAAGAQSMVAWSKPNAAAWPWKRQCCRARELGLEVAMLWRWTRRGAMSGLCGADVGYGVATLA
jgi:hypothetical protein